MHTLTRPLAVVAAATLALLAGSVAPAAAAPGDAFDPRRPTVFISQGTPTQLSTAAVGEGGDFTFSAEGAPLGGQGEYNGIGYNTADNYLYGFTSAAVGNIPATALVRIGQGGVVTRVGNQLFPSDGDNSSLQVGAFGPGGFLYAADTTGSDMFVIDVSDGSLEDTVPITGGSLQAAGLVSDWTFSQGFLWGVGDNRTIVRVDPSNGQLDQWALAEGEVSPGFAGAAWTYLGGDLGFSHNISGRIDRIRVTNPAAATPSFALVDSRGGPANGRNDGAAGPGLPVDLAVTKTSAGFAAGKTVTYTITVKNNGEGFSTGWTVSDDVPSELSGVEATSDDADCTVDGNAVECTGGELAPGDSATVTLTADVPAGQTDDVENTVTVAGNEPDPDNSNNTDSVVDTVKADVDDEQDPEVPDNPSVPAGGSGSTGGSGFDPGLGALGALGAATVAGAVLVRRRLS